MAVGKPQCAAPSRMRAQGELCQHRPGLVWGGFSFTKLLCFYQNGFLTVIAFFFFLRENVIFNYISLGFH